MEESTEINMENKEEIFGLFFLENENLLFIKSNKLGLRNFLTKIENAYNNFDNHLLNNTEIALFSNNNSNTDYWGDIELGYIQPVSIQEEKKIVEEISKTGFQSKLFGIGCFLLTAILLFIFVVGIITIYSSIF